MYIELAKKLRSLGHEDMAQLIDELNTQKTPTEAILQNLNIDSKLIKKSIIPWLFHIRVFHGRELENRQHRWKTLEELDKDFPLALTLLPRVPSVDATKEDSNTPRVSLAYTIEGAAGSLGLKQTHSTYIAIYSTIAPTEVISPFSGNTEDRPSNNMLYVHDAEQWGEVWSLRPVPVERVSIIKPGENIYEHG